MDINQVVEGFAVAMYEGACEQASISKELGVLFAQARLHCDNKPRQTGLDHDHKITSLFQQMNVGIVHLKGKCNDRSESRFPCYSRWLRHVVPFNDGNCRLTMSIAKGRGAHDALPKTF